MTYRIEGQMLLIYDAKAFTEKCTFCLRFSTNAILMLISSSLEFHELLSVRTSAWLRSLAWIKSSICNQQLNWGFSTVHVFLKNIHFLTLGKMWLSCTLGMWECTLPFCLPLLPGLLGLFDPGLNSEQQQSRKQWDGWMLIPKEVRKQEARSSVKRRKAGGIVRPKCFISHSQCLMHTILLFSSWRGFQTWVSWFSSPFLFYPKRFGL